MQIKARSVGLGVLLFNNVDYCNVETMGSSRERRANIAATSFLSTISGTCKGSSADAFTTGNVRLTSPGENEGIRGKHAPIG